MMAQLMKFATNPRSEDVLLEVAASICATAHIDFESLDKPQARAC
jgi:hypothetical protein